MNVDDILTVEISHIGSSGTPIAKVLDGSHHNLIVYGGKPGDSMKINVNKTEEGVYVGELRDPSPEQKARTKAQRARERMRKSTHEKTDKSRNKHMKPLLRSGKERIKTTS